MSAFVVFCAVGGGVAPVAADPPPDAAAAEPADWWDDLLAAGENPGEDYVSPPIEPAVSAPAIESTPLDTSDHARTLPSPGVGEVAVAERGEARPVGETPVEVSAGSQESVGETVRVEVLDAEAAERAGVHGFVFRLSGKDGAALSADGELPATLEVDYSGFANLFGGGYADRLRVVALPECAVVDPVPEDCDRASRRLSSRNDRNAQRLVVTIDDLTTVQAPSPAPPSPAPTSTSTSSSSTTTSSSTTSTSTTAPAADEEGEPRETTISTVPTSSVRELEAVAPVQSGGGGMVLAVEPGPESEGGSFKATPFTMSGDWEVGVGSGEFSCEVCLTLRDGSVVGSDHRERWWAG